MSLPSFPRSRIKCKSNVLLPDLVALNWSIGTFNLLCSNVRPSISPIFSHDKLSPAYLTPWFAFSALQDRSPVAAFSEGAHGLDRTSMSTSTIATTRRCHGVCCGRCELRAALSRSSRGSFSYMTFLTGHVQGCALGLIIQGHVWPQICTCGVRPETTVC